MPHYHVRTKRGSIELDTYDLGEAIALWQRLPNGASVMEYGARGWVKIDPRAPRSDSLEPNRALARAKLETLAWEQTPEGRRGPSGSRREVLLDTTDGTGMVRLSDLTDNQLRRYIGPGRLEEAGDMRKNGRGIYSGTPAKNGDYVIHKQGGQYHAASAKYYVDRVDAGGTHQTIGSTRGFSSIADAVQGARDDAHVRGGRNGVIFEQRGDELVQAHAISAHRANSRRPQSSLGLHEDPQLLQQLVEMSAESMELPNYKDADVTPELIRVAKEYDAALRWTLDEVVMRFPPKNGATSEDLWNANAPYLVLMTLQKSGRSIGDGDWNQFYSDTTPVEKFLDRKLGLYFHSGGGEGKLGDAIMNAASETCGDPNYDKDFKPNASRAEADETAARELSLYIENEYSLVGAPNSQGLAIEKNLLRKIKNGTFDLKKSEQAWMYLIESGAKKYCQGQTGSGAWNQVFSKPTRELVAYEFATTFYEEFKLGNKGR